MKKKIFTGAGVAIVTPFKGPNNEEVDYDKLNAAFYYGGFRMLSNTLADSFKLRIDQYIAVDFVAFGWFIPWNSRLPKVTGDGSC